MIDAYAVAARLCAPLHPYTGNEFCGGIWDDREPRLFGRRRLRMAGGRVLLFAEQPGLQPVQVDVDNRRRIESENLRQGQTADDGVAERLAYLRADPGTHHHWHPTQEPRHPCD